MDNNLPKVSIDKKICLLAYAPQRGFLVLFLNPDVQHYSLITQPKTETKHKLYKKFILGLLPEKGGGGNPGYTTVDSGGSRICR